MKNTKLLKIFKNTLPSLFFPIIFLFITEVLLSTLYRLTSFKYFENYNQTYERCCSNNNSPDKNLSKLKTDLASTKKKIAVFGGSSGAGFGSSKSFSDFLEDSLDGNYIIHNYAQPGATFYRNQAMILKEIIPYYDIFIIYAGHNEVWQVLYEKAIKSKTGYLMPNNELVSKNQALNALNEPKKRIKIIKLAVDGDNYSSTINQFLGELVLPNLLIRTGKRINLAFKSATKRFGFENNNYDQKPFLIEEKIISDEDRKLIIQNFKNEIESIIPLIGEGKTLIISKVLSNDIYPPILDLITTKDQEATSKESLLLTDIYRDILTKRYLSKDKVKKLSSGAHSGYLKSLISCNIVPINLEDKIDQNCLELLKKIRGKDQLPYRILPEINQYISSLKGEFPNVKIIDPYLEVNNSKTINEYLSYFVDFQHPSFRGHALISKNIIRKLRPFLEVNYQFIDKCDSYVLISDNIQKTFKTDLRDLNKSLNININWLENSIRGNAMPLIHEFYLESATKKRTECSKS